MARDWTGAWVVAADLYFRRALEVRRDSTGGCRDGGEADSGGIGGRRNC